MSNIINTEGNIDYIFGDKLFVGYVKFYKDSQAFGYLSSNNWKMNISGKFTERYQDFYIDKDSFDEKVVFNQLVVFRPAYVNNRLKAINICQYKKDIHSHLAIDNILYHNTIHWEKKNRNTIPGGLSDIRYDISIFSLSGIRRYELIEKCIAIYKDNGGEALLYALDTFFSIVGGEKEYSWKLHGEYENKNKEYNAIKCMFDLIDKLTAQKIVLKHASLQFLAPHEILLSLAGKLNDDFIIPKEVCAEHRTKKLQIIIGENKAFQNFYDEEAKTYTRRGSIDTKERENKFLRLLNYCPNDIKDSLEEEVKKQITEGIQTFMLNIDYKTRLEKTNLLRYCADYLDDRQKNVIEKSFRSDDIKEYVEVINKDIKREFESFAKCETDNYYRIKPEIKSLVIPHLVEALLQCLKATLDKINKGWSVDICRYKKIDSIIKTNRFITKECFEESRTILKQYLFDICEKKILDKKYNDGLVRTLKDVLEKEEYDSTLASYYKTVLDKGSLDAIFQFFIYFEYSDIPINLNELISNKSIEEIAECGDTLYKLPDKGSSLLETIIMKIRDSYDTKGDFLQYYPLSYNKWDFHRNEKEEEGLNRYNFLIKVISNMAPEKSSCFINMLSCHDRIILSRNNKFLCITKDDVINELLFLGVNVEMDVILQEISFSSQAIIEIITSTPCHSEEELQEKLLWLRKYYLINNRIYISIEQRKYYETKLVDYLIDMSHKFNIDLLYYGIDVDNHLIPLSYGDLTCCQSFLENLCNTGVEDCGSFLRIWLYGSWDGHDSVNKIIEKIFNMSFDIQDNRPCLIMEKNAYTPQTIKAYIALNVLNNLHLLVTDRGKSSPIIPFSNQEMISYITGVYSLKYKKGEEDRTRFKWDEGDVDYTVSWHHIVIEFEHDIDDKVKSILKEVEPKLIATNFRTLEYHDGPYGDENDGYYSDSDTISRMTLKLFKAYKEGCIPSLL